MGRIFWLVRRAPATGAAILLWVPRRLKALAGSFRFWAVCLVALLVVIVLFYALADRYAPLTTDAYVQAYVIQVAPQVEGRVVKVLVHEGQEVKAGAPLFELDPRPFAHKVAILEARRVETRQEVRQLDTDLAAAKADEARAQAESSLAQSIFQQEQRMVRSESTTERRFLEAKQKHRASQAAVRAAGEKVRHARQALAARVGDEHALIARVQAQLAEAQLNLEYTRVYAPCDGRITDLQLRAGAYVHTGQAALALIDTRHWLIVANFPENSLPYMRPGQPARVALRGVPGRLLPARVVAVGWGVGQGQGVPSGKLPDVKRSPSWIPPSQRFQVRLEFLEPESVPLRVGMTGSVSVRVESGGILDGVTEAVHQFVAWLYYL